MANQTMPKAVEEVFEALWQDLGILELRWKFFRQLFDTDERVELLNKFAALLFGHIELIMLSDICLRICHLTDPPQMGKYKNASLKRIVEVIEDVDPQLSKTIMTPLEITGPGPKMLSKAMSEAIQKSEPFRDLRNRFLAHSDLGRRVDPVPPTTLQDVEDCLVLFRQIMNAVERHYKNTTTSSNIPTSNDGDTLINYLKKIAQDLDS